LFQSLQHAIDHGSQDLIGSKSRNDGHNGLHIPFTPLRHIQRDDLRSCLGAFIGIDGNTFESAALPLARLKFGCIASATCSQRSTEFTSVYLKNMKNEA
jgi:hypothetical protein